MEKKKKQIIIPVVLTAIMFLSLFGTYLYGGKKTEEKGLELSKEELNVIQSCVYYCQQALRQGVDLSNGPCLSDMYVNWPYRNLGWVCDVAHYPREDVDNLPENQCSDFREGKANKFVEVDPNCYPIKFYTPDRGVVLLVRT